MAQETTPSTTTRVLRIDKVDHMRHFSKDPPLVKLTALFLCRLPYLVSTCGGLVLWWRLH